MARNGKTHHSGAPTATPAQRAADTPVAGDGGVDAARNWLHQWLLVAQDAAGWLEEAQRLNLHATTTWIETLAQAAGSAQRARGLDELMAVAAQMWQRQVNDGAHRLGEGFDQMLKAELRWAEQAREQSAALAAQWLPAADRPAPAAETGMLPMLQSMGQVQSEWLAMTQRWIDSVNTATRH